MWSQDCRSSPILVLMMYISRTKKISSGHHMQEPGIFRKTRKLHPFADSKTRMQFGQPSHKFIQRGRNTPKNEHMKITCKFFVRPLWYKLVVYIWTNFIPSSCGKQIVGMDTPSPMVCTSSGSSSNAHWSSYAAPGGGCVGRFKYFAKRRKKWIKFGNMKQRGLACKISRSLGSQWGTEETKQEPRDKKNTQLLLSRPQLFVRSQRHI